MSAALTHGGLFEGYGGTTMAAETVLGPLDRRWHSDIKPASIALLEARHPDVPNLGDLTAIDWTDVEPVDVLTASWPCQPFSAAGRRLANAAEEDPRALWPHVARAVAELRPSIFLGENVPRIVNAGELRRAVRALANLGYVGAWRCLTAATVGAPHKRDRCFIVAVDATAHPLSLELRDEPGRGSGTGRQGAGVATHNGSQRPLRLLKTPTAQLATNGGSQHPDKRKAGGHGPTLADELEWLGPEEYEPAVRRWERARGVPAPAPTVPSARRVDRPSISPAFVEWMMGVPAGWVTGVPGLTPGQQLSLLGDGVVPQQGATAYRELLGHLLTAQAAA